MSTLSLPPLNEIAQLLVKHSLLTSIEALHYQKVAQARNVSFLQVLTDNNTLPGATIAALIASSFNLPLLDLNSINPATIPLSVINEKLILNHGVLPLFTRENHLVVALDEPSKQTALKEIQFHTGLACSPIIVQTRQLNGLINQLLHSKEIHNLSQDSNNAVLYKNNHESLATSEPSAPITTPQDEIPLVKFVNKIILDAIHLGASDIHFEPYEQNYRIRYRLDGVLSEIEAPAPSFAARISSRIKVMANLDISERRLPQDGHFKMPINTDKAINLRVSTCPMITGEKIVLRILDSSAATPKIDTLGFTPQQQANFLKAINKPQGMILVTGPTGSGKTITLYTALTLLNTVERNISSAEDPVEIKVAGINQVNINPKLGLSFAKTLRALLRQDPDTIMVGEIRDQETAEIAIRAAQTGHLVLSSVHTNSAVATLTRLLNLGIASFEIASSVSLIVAQRLARKLCIHCKQIRNDLSAETLLQFGFSASESKTLTLYRAQGCKLCNKGYRGRVGLFEVLPISETIKELILAKASAATLFQLAKTEGLTTLYEAGLAQIKAGITSVEEVMRMSNEN